MVSQTWLPFTTTICITTWLLHQVSAVPQPLCSIEIFGQPSFGSCHSLLFGTVGETYEMDTRGINEIDRRDHLFHISPESLRYPRNRPFGVSINQWQQRHKLPQPRYPDLWVNSHPPGSVPPPTRTWPVPWSNGGRNSISD